MKPKTNKAYNVPLWICILIAGILLAVYSMNTSWLGEGGPIVACLALSGSLMSILFLFFEWDRRREPLPNPEKFRFTWRQFYIDTPTLHRRATPPLNAAAGFLFYIFSNGDPHIASRSRLLSEAKQPCRPNQYLFF
ncbi:MAG: hypothetical protein RJB39_22 [Candidatus Parcubacteria bacterium]|jgi:uncharacterized membrane protein YbhN (UPF0104 family)